MTNTKHTCNDGDSKMWPQRVMGTWTVRYWTQGSERPVINQYGIFATQADAQAYITELNCGPVCTFGDW